MGRTWVLAAAAALILFPGAPCAAGPDWSKAEKAPVVLIYPGVASWEFLAGEDHRLGAREIRKVKKECAHCHISKEGELDLKVDEMAAGTLTMKRSHRPFEPEPEAGKKGVMSATLQAAYDSEFLYIRVQWPSGGDGWKAAKGSSAPPDRVSMQMNKADVSFKKYGCFITCHNDVTTMPGAPSKKEVSSHPYYKALDRDDVRIYAKSAREAWDRPAPPAELDKLRARGALIDLISMEFSSGEAEAKDGWVLDDRRWGGADGLDGSSGTWADGAYTAVFRRRLGLKGPHDVGIRAGESVAVSIAIHDGGVQGRKHHVSFPLTIGLGAEGDLNALNTGN